jgi:transposase
MPEAYSLDLRERVARFVEGGRSCRAAAALFSVSVAFVVRLMKSFRATGRLAPKPSGGRRHVKLDPHQTFNNVMDGARTGISARLRAVPRWLSLSNPLKEHRPWESLSPICLLSRRLASIWPSMTLTLLGA